jgi:excisionase family DNA binding protein
LEIIIMKEGVPLTLTVPEAGRRYLGLSRASSYEAASRGEIPTIRIGRLLRVPVRAMERMLDEVSAPAQNPRKRQASGDHERDAV